MTELDEDLFRSKSNRKKFETWLSRTFSKDTLDYGGTYNPHSGYWRYATGTIQTAWTNWVTKRWDQTTPF